MKMKINIKIKIKIEKGFSFNTNYIINIQKTENVEQNLRQQRQLKELPSQSQQQ